MAPHSDVAMICTRLSKLTANIKHYKTEGADIIWSMERPHFLTFSFLPLWEQLC